MKFPSPIIIMAVLGIGGVACYTCSKRKAAADEPKALPTPVQNIDQAPSLATLRDLTDKLAGAKAVSERPIVDVRDIPASYVPIDFTRLTR